MISLTGDDTDWRYFGPPATPLRPSAAAGVARRWSVGNKRQIYDAIDEHGGPPPCQCRQCAAADFNTASTMSRFCRSDYVQAVVRRRHLPAKGTCRTHTSLTLYGVSSAQAAYLLCVRDLLKNQDSVGVSGP